MQFEAAKKRRQATRALEATRPARRLEMLAALQGRLGAAHEWRLADLLAQQQQQAAAAARAAALGDAAAADQQAVVQQQQDSGGLLLGVQGLAQAQAATQLAATQACSDQGFRLAQQQAAAVASSLTAGPLLLRGDAPAQGSCSPPASPSQAQRQSAPLQQALSSDLPSPGSRRHRQQQPHHAEQQQAEELHSNGGCGHLQAAAAAAAAEQLPGSLLGAASLASAISDAGSIAWVEHGSAGGVSREGSASSAHQQQQHERLSDASDGAWQAQAQAQASSEAVAWEVHARLAAKLERAKVAFLELKAAHTKSRESNKALRGQLAEARTAVRAACARQAPRACLHAWLPACQPACMRTMPCLASRASCGAGLPHALLLRVFSWPRAGAAAARAAGAAAARRCQRQQQRRCC